MKEKTNIEKIDNQNPFRLHLGGSWRYDAWDSRVPLRIRGISSERSLYVGFRLVLQTKEKQ